MQRSLCLLSLAICAFITATLVSGTTTPMTAQSSDAPTFSKDVAPILYKNCVSCHRAGEIAPMSLLTYAQVRPYARSIGSRIEQGTMPPWHAEAAPGTFVNERGLTSAEKEIIT